MCVLLLSGMQKDDLDVSMLTKLRRHNVNINDMNNEQLLQSCLQPQGNSSNEAKKINETLPFNKLKNNFLEDKTTSHSEVTQYPRTTENYPNTTSTLHQSGHEFQKNNDKALEKNVYDEGKEEKDIRLKLGTRDMKTNIVDDRLMKNQSSLTAQERKRSISEMTNSSESYTLNRLLANLAKRNLSTKPITTPIFINVDDADAKLLYSMPMRDTENNTNGNSALKHHFTYLPIQQIARSSTIQEETIDKESETNGDNPNIMNHTNFSDAIIFLNTSRSFNLFNPNTEIISNLNSKTTDNLDWSSNRYLSSVQKSDTSTATNIEPNLKISRDIIKEIADNVKEIILRGLRKELQETTTVTTTAVMSTKAVHSTTIRESEFQRTLQNENPNKQDSIMSKFLEMFELFKSLKQNTTDIKNESKKDIIEKERSHKIDFKEVNVYPYREIPPTLPNNIIQNQLPYHTKQVNVLKQRPFLNSENNFHFAPHLHEYRSYGSIMNQLPILKQEPHNGLLPLTVQTNNIEIPPLGIPLDKSQNLIRENIIVSTRAPYNIVPNKNDKSSQSKKGVRHRSSRHLEAGKALNRSKYINPRLSSEPHTPPSHNIQPKNNDVIRFTLKNNEDSNYNAHYYEKINLGKYKPQPKSDETNYQEIPRFHEKLEKIEHFLDYPEENKNTYRNDCCDWKFGYLKAMVDCCNRKIASRQQMPLNNIKRQSYDDGHFNKFLQSQQKVTDMLEKILGDKGTVHSVETA